MPLDAETLGRIYLDIKNCVINAGFDHEIDWQAELVFDQTTETDFLREAAWVVLSSGFRETIVRRSFADVSAAFLNWLGARAIVERLEVCRAKAIRAFRNQRKIDGIIGIVQRVADEGIEGIKAQIRGRGIEFIQELPFMGPITSFHLAKNIGFDVVKPDRHLVRVSVATGYASPEELCRTICTVVGDSVRVVDIVIWRYATLKSDYESDFQWPFSVDAKLC